MTDFQYDFDNPMGDFAPHLWPCDAVWQNVRAQLWNYFTATKNDQTAKPLGKAEFGHRLETYHTKRLEPNANCFSYACGIVTRGLTVEPFLLEHMPVGDMLRGETSLRTVYDDPCERSYKRMLSGMDGLTQCLQTIGFKTGAEKDYTDTPVIGLSHPNHDYHFLKVLTGFNHDIPRVAFLEKNKDVSYHDTPSNYFTSPEYKCRKQIGYGAATLFFAPDTLNELVIRGERTVTLHDNRPVAYDYKAVAHYDTPSL